MQKYIAEKTVANFMMSDSFIRIIMGPVGSGKSTGCLMEMVRRMMDQAPAPDGIRHTRFAIVRQTLQQIKQTALKEFDVWLQPIAHFKVSDSTIYFSFNDIRSEVHLIPLDTEEDQRRLLSMQLTGVWINEFPEIDPMLIPNISGRIGRYPSAAQGGPTWNGIIMDGNFPTIGGEWHRLMELTTPPDWQIFKQPGGLSELAENLGYLNQTPETMKLSVSDPIRQAQGRKYYERLARGQSEDWIRRYVHAEYGEDPSGSAVFRTTFKVGVHVVDEIFPVPGHPLLIGQDFGRDPVSIIGQMDHRGRLLILEEVWANDIGLEKHLKEYLRPTLSKERYTGKAVAIVGDPSGTARSTLYEETSFDLLKRCGFKAFPAPTNDIDPRIRAVEAWFLESREGGPAIIIDRKRCPTLIRALNGGYRFAKQRSGILKPTPDKNEFSHGVDALQYLCCAAHGNLIATIHNHLGRYPASQRNRVKVTAAGWT